MQDITGSTTSSKKTLSFDTAARIALSATFALALMVITFGPAISFLGTKSLVILLGTLIALALFVVARLSRGNFVVSPTVLTLALWLVPFAYLLSTFFSGTNAGLAFSGLEYEADTFGFVLTLTVYAALLGLALRRDSDHASFFRTAAYAFGAFIGIQALLVLIARIVPSAIAPLSNLAGSFSDAGMIAGVGAIVIMIALRFLGFAGLKRVLLYGVLALSLFVVALANSMLVWILIGLTALGLFIESLMRHRSSSDDGELDGVATLAAELDVAVGEKRPLVVPLIALALSVVFVIGASVVGNALATTFGTSFIDVRPSWQSTFEVGSHVYASSPLFGSGPATFGEEWLKFRDRSINDTVFWNVDFVSGVGYIPTSMVTTGVLGALAWLGFLGLFLFIGIRALLFRLPQERMMRFTAIASFAASVSVLTLMMFMVPGPVVLFLGFTAIGIFIASLRYGKERIEWGVAFSRSPRVGFAAVFVLTLLLLGALYAGYAVSVRYAAMLAYGAAAQDLSQGNLDKADANIRSSLALVEDDRSYRLAALSSVARMNMVANATGTSPTETQQQFQVALTAALQVATAATQIAPDNYQNWLALGGVYQSVVPLKIDGAAAAAREAFGRAMQLAPTNASLPYLLAQLSIAENDYPGAEGHLFEAIALKRDYTQAILLLSQLQVALGKATEALQAVEAAIYFAPNDPATLFQAGVLRLGTGDRVGAVAALTRAAELNPRYANARYFLAVAHAVSGNTEAAVAELDAVAALSEENAAAVAPDRAALAEGKNPFPAARLRTLGIPSAPVEEPEPSDTSAGSAVE